MDLNLIELIKKSDYQHFIELGESLEKAKNPEEIVLSEGYMGRCYKSINDKLRERMLSDNDSSLFKGIEQSINNALDKHDRYNNKLVFRDECRSIDDGQEEKVFSWFRNSIGKVICFPAFMSCYPDMSRLPKGSPLIFKIKTSQISRAFNLKNVHPNHPEQEILYKSKSCFKVIEVDENNNLVLLEETYNTPDFTIFSNEEYFALCRKKSRGTFLKYSDI